MRIALFISMLLLIFGCNTYETKKEYYSNGNLKADGEFKNDLLHGETRVYYPNGHLESIRNYKNGKVSGPAVDFYEDGVVKRKMTYKNDTLDGKVEVFFSSGKLNKNFSYRDGQIEGELIEYDNVGNLYSITTYKKGYKVNFKVFHPSGNIFLDEDRKDDERHGNYTVYYEDGITIKEQGTYSDGERNGWFVSYFLSGSIKDSLLFSNGNWQKAHHYDSLGEYTGSKKRKSD